MNNIQEFLELARKQYYGGKPILSDKVFDGLNRRYGKEYIGYNNENGTVPHLHKMFSLNKFYTGEGKHPVYNDPVETVKLDGSAISLVYYGELIQAATRGNGDLGEDIIHLIKDSGIVPTFLPNSRLVQIKGEIVAPKTIKNSRNYASGALHLKDKDEFLTRELTFIAYEVQPTISHTFRVDMDHLDSFGFKTVLTCDTDAFPTDGKVIRENNNNQFYDAGFTAVYPKGAHAVKDRDDVAIEETVLNEVTWQIGKGGKITPVAIFNEVIIEDAKISRATLHNPGFIEGLDLQLGDTILVTRSGGVIPKVVGKL